MNFAIKRISQGLKQNFSGTIITLCHTFSDFIKWYWLLCRVIKSIMVWYPDCLIENSKDHGYAYVIVMGELKAFFLYDSATYISSQIALHISLLILDCPFETEICVVLDDHWVDSRVEFVVVLKWSVMLTFIRIPLPSINPCWLASFFTVLASFLVRTILFGMVYASGIYYVAILKDMKTSNAAAAWVGSILIAFVSMACK